MPFKSFRFVSLACVFLALVFTACTQKKQESAESRGANVVKTVNLGIWSNYVFPETLAEFEKKTGIRVVVSNYSSNEELLAKLQAGAGGFDLVVPSDYMVSSMSKLGLIQKLDPSKIPNAKGLEPRFQKLKYDPKNEYSIPYHWGTTGIAVNRKLYSGEIKGWKDVFEKPDLAGKIAMLDDVREVIGAALKAQGYSLNSRDPKQLEQAGKLLVKARSRVKLYSSESLQTLTLGEAAVTQAYSTDAMMARTQTGGKVDYLLPQEGGTLWIDNLVIPAGAKNVAEAHALIDFLIEPQMMARTVKSIFVAPTSAGAMSILPPELIKNRTLFPSEKDLAKFEMLEDLGDAMQIWDRVWTEVKAGAE